MASDCWLQTWPTQVSFHDCGAINAIHIFTFCNTASLTGIHCIQCIVLLLQPDPRQCRAALGVFPASSSILFHCLLSCNIGKRLLRSLNWSPALVPLSTEQVLMWLPSTYLSEIPACLSEKYLVQVHIFAHCFLSLHWAF